MGQPDFNGGDRSPKLSGRRPRRLLLGSCPKKHPTGAFKRHKSKLSSLASIGRPGENQTLAATHLDARSA